MKANLSICVVLLLASGMAQASPSIERAKYVNSKSLPDQMFLRQFLRLATPFDAGHEKEDATLLLQHKVGFDDHSSAEDFYDFLASLKQQMNDDHRAAKRQLLCPLDAPRPSGPDVFRVMDDLDDKWDALGNAALDRIRAKLDERQARNLHEWMDELKAQTTFLRFNHAERYRGQDGNIVRQKVCGRFDSLAVNQ